MSIIKNKYFAHKKERENDYNARTYICSSLFLNHTLFFLIFSRLHQVQPLSDSHAVQILIWVVQIYKNEVYNIQKKMTTLHILSHIEGKTDIQCCHFRNEYTEKGLAMIYTCSSIDKSNLISFTSFILFTFVHHFQGARMLI